MRSTYLYSAWCRLSLRSGLLQDEAAIFPLSAWQRGSDSHHSMCGSVPTVNAHNCWSGTCFPSSSNIIICRQVCNIIFGKLLGGRICPFHWLIFNSCCLHVVELYSKSSVTQEVNNPLFLGVSFSISHRLWSLPVCSMHISSWTPSLSSHFPRLPLCHLQFTTRLDLLSLLQFYHLLDHFSHINLDFYQFQ